MRNNANMHVLGGLCMGGFSLRCATCKSFYENKRFQFTFVEYIVSKNELLEEM
jgi:hypothetical protein